MKQRVFYWIVLLVGVVGVTCVVVAEALIAEGVLQQVLLHLGEGLLIAAILAGTVDVFVKRRLISESSRALFPSIVGHLVPDEFREEIREITNFTVIRRDLKLEYAFDIAPEFPGAYIVTIKFEYRILNFASTRQPYRVLFWVDNNAQGQFRQITRAAAFGMKSRLGRGADFRDDGGSAKKNGSGTAWVFSRRVYVDPVTDVTRAPKVWGETKQVLPQEYQDNFLIMLPTIGVEVKATAPAGLQVDVMFGHRCDQDRIERGQHHWELPTAFAPYATVSLSWRKLTAAVSHGTSSHK